MKMMSQHSLCQLNTLYINIGSIKLLVSLKTVVVIRILSGKSLVLKNPDKLKFILFYDASMFTKKLLKFSKTSFGLFSRYLIHLLELKIVTNMLTVELVPSRNKSSTTRTR